MLNIKNKKAIILFIFIFTSGFSYLRNSSQCKATAKILSKSEIESNTDHKSQLLPAKQQAEFLLSEVLAEEVINRLRLSDQNDKPLRPENVQKSLKTRLLTENVISVSYFDSDKKLSEKVINTLLEIFINYSIDSRQPPPPINDLVARLPKKEVLVHESEITPEQIQKWRNEEHLRKEKYRESIERYWQEIEEMNKNIPSGLQIDKYQSFDVKVLEFTSSCSIFRYLK